MPETEKSWNIASKIPSSVADRVTSDFKSGADSMAKRATSTIGSVFRRITKNIETIGQSITWGDEIDSLPGNSPTDAERLAWEHKRSQMRRKYNEKEEEVNTLRKRVKELEDELNEVKIKTLTEIQMEDQIKSLDAENEILVDHYLSEMAQRKKYLELLEDTKGRVRVYCRIRASAPNEASKKNPMVVYAADDHTVLVKAPNGLKVFHFNRVFGTDATQDQIFDDLSNMVSVVMDGYNVCIFSYGESGSGKTFTLVGDRERPGLVPQMITRLYKFLENERSRTKSYSDVSISVVELFNDQILDLLVEHSDYRDFEVNPDNQGMMQVPGVLKKHLGCSTEFHELFQKATTNRRAAHMRLNTNSGQSHLVITIPVLTTNKVSKTSHFGKMTFIDLAGSEKQTGTGPGENAQKDYHSVQDSLSSLGDVFTALALSQPTVPYKSSRLTALMQDSLGGNAKTVMIVNTRESEAHRTETLNSLNYASRLRTVHNQAGPVSNSERVNKLHVTTERLKKGELETK